MKVKVKLPVNIKEKNLNLFDPYTSYEIDEQPILFLKNVIVTYSGICIDDTGIRKESHHAYEKQYQNILNEVSYYYSKINQDEKKLICLNDDNIYLIVHHPWFNYYHWMMECVLRIWAVKDETHNMILVLPDCYKNTDYIQGSLKPFSFKDYLYIPREHSLYIKNICLPAIKPICDSYNISALNQIRELYLQHNFLYETNKKFPYGSKLYLSRKKAERKRVMNENLVESLTNNFGFKTIYNEDHSFLEQINIYSTAEQLISIHGSGLTNMLFMSKNTNVLEIHKAKTNELDHPSFVFWYEADALGINYFHQVAKALNENDDYFFGDFLIDTQLLKENLQKMLDI